MAISLKEVGSAPIAEEITQPTPTTHFSRRMHSGWGFFRLMYKSPDHDDRDIFFYSGIRLNKDCQALRCQLPRRGRRRWTA